MSALPVESTSLDSQHRLDILRLRLVDAAANLRPQPRLDDMAQRIKAVSNELEAIMRELPLVVHVSQLEDGGLHEELQELDNRLAGGWVPEASPVGDVVARLRESLKQP